MMSCAQQAPAEEGSFLDRTERWWHLVHAAVTLAVVIAWLFLPEIPTGQRILGLGLIAVFVLSFLVGSPLRDRGPSVSALSVGYCLLICTIVIVLIQMHPTSSFLLFVLFSQVWSVLPTRWAVGFSVGAAAALTILPSLLGGWSVDNTIDGLITGLLIAGLGVLFGTWVTGIIRESERRQALIHELESTRSELAQAHHREGVLAERQRLAAEIHDTLAQGFMSILVLSQAPPAHDQLARIARTARENLAEARSLIEALGPDELRSGTLAEACRRSVERLDAEAEDLEATFELAGEPRTLPANAEIVLLRATQEALVNVRKHAQATRVEVCLTYAETGASVWIRDDGGGFDVRDVGEGFGLRGMRTRAEDVSGTVEISSQLGAGTTVRVEVP